MNRVEVEPALLRWARERAGLSTEALTARFPRIVAWERGETRPTLKQLERFAKATFTPVGFLFLPEPPVERVPIRDFRTISDTNLKRPSPNLLDTILSVPATAELVPRLCALHGRRTARFRRRGPSR